MASPAILVSGPARSGKSEWAETLARDSQKNVIYVATARIDPGDREWRERIEQHRSRRPATGKPEKFLLAWRGFLRKQRPKAVCLSIR